VVIGGGAVVAGQAGFGAIMLVSLAGSGAFMVWLANGWDRPLEDASELYKYGRPANAVVEKIADEALRPDGVRTAKLTLHVSPVNESQYRTTRVLALPKARVPAVGERMTLKFDPQSRKNVVLLEEEFEVVDHITASMRNFA
jgi:hypothetical protein